MTDDPAIPAATLILVRDMADGPPEYLMVERAATMAFAAGALVFPGGRIDPEDVELGERLGLPNGAAIIAAVRETIEETAVAVALDPLPDAAHSLELQRDLLGGMSLAAMLDHHSLRLVPTALTLFARWLPKFHATRRFDTIFFIASAPPGDWHPNVGERENSSAEWVTARDVLDRDRGGTASLIFPTRTTLHRLAPHGGYAEIVADAAAHPVETVTPWLEERDGERWLTIPGHLGYPVTQEKIEGLWRG